MPSRSHSKAIKYSVVMLARQAGVEDAARAFGLDPRTVRSWQQTVEIPDDAWATVEMTLLARAEEMVARGQTSGLVATLTGAGISSRNRRYQTLIERREQRRSVEQEAEQTEAAPAYRVMLDAMPEANARLWYWETIEPELERRSAEGDEPGESADMDMAAFHAWLLETVRPFRDLAADEVEARQAIADEAGNQSPRQSDHEPGWQELFVAALDALDDPLPAPELAPSPTATPEPPATPPEASQRVPAPSPAPRPDLHVVSDTEQREYEDERHLWHRID